MDASKKQREPVAFKSLAELKRFIRPGVEFKTVSHANHADMVGLTRVVTTVQTVGFYSKIKDQPEHPFSTCNHGKGFYTDFGKAGNYIFDGTTVKVKDTRKQDRGVIYELEFYDREQNMEETMMDRKMVNFIREQYPPGTRIRLNAMDDPYAHILPGTEGEVDFVDDKGQIFMKWDNGRTLPLAPGEDSFTVLPPKLTSLKLYMPLTADLYERNEYGDFAALARELHERGFRVLLTVTPFVSGDGPIFRAYRNSGAFVRMSDGRAAIAEWAGGYSAFYDITDPQVFDMLRDRLTALQDSCGVDGFVFDCEAALPYARFSREGTAEYLKKWSELGLGFGYSLYTISRTRGMAPYVSDLQMDARLDWAFLPQAVSNLISANLLGFPYSTVRADPAQPADSAGVDQKLLLRYMQLASLLPVPAIGMAPWRITDPQIARQCRDALEIRGKLGGD